MRNPPRITVITPSYNQGGFIGDTIESVLGQDYPDLEYLVIDGGSKDETLDVLKKYEGRLAWVSERDRGQSDAINKGIRKATGDIIAYLNSDDLYEPGALKKAAQYFQANPERLWLTGRCGIIDANGRETRGCITAYKNFLLRRYGYNILLVTNFISQPATFIRREAFGELGLFDESQHRVMDYEFWLRLGRKYPPGFIDDRLALFRVHPGSKTSSSFHLTFREELQVARKYTDSAVLNGLHYLSYLGIRAAYTVLDAAARRKAF
ncbi:MAG: glycosyltransferase [Deltaproteobacteria bacterium]|nr:glycosyltransferase [Deltaproteobacteria bacterium]MCL4873474.1 glycosyltransferase [bacterium]